MMEHARLLAVKDGVTYDMSNLVSTIRWHGRRGAPARDLQVEFIDDDGYKHERTGIDITKGHQCVFYWKEEELFRGMFMKQTQSNKKTITIKAYDNGIYLSNNSDTFNYSNKTASQIFSDVCSRFEIPTGAVADSVYRIPELPKPNTTAWDVIADAMSLTVDATGVRYYVISRGGELCFIERRQNILQWVIETGVNIEEYTQQKSIERIKTRIKLLSREGAVLAEASDFDLEGMLGIFQDVITLDDDMNSGQLSDIVKTTLAENNSAVEALSLSASGLPDVIAGVGVFIIIKPLNISRTYYVEEDTHTFDGNYHSMRLQLSQAIDAQATGAWGV